MERFLKAYWKTLVFFAAISLIGGFFTGLYLLDSYPAPIRQQLVEELQAEGIGQVDPELFTGIVSGFQAAAYGLLLGAAGIFFGKKTGLWKDERTFTKKPLAATAVVAVLGGLGLILPDMLFFGPRSEVITASYAVKPTLPYILATVTYGAVTEEVMLRLFMMSLITFLLHKLFGRKQDRPATATVIAANVITALLFAAGHLPATLLLLGSSPLILFRCFLLNGLFGAVFGWLYRRYGLRYAMLAHGGCHIVSKLIWVLFL